MTTESHCCAPAHSNCIDSQEATSLRYRLTCLTRERFAGKNGAPSGSDLENMAPALDRIGFDVAAGKIIELATTLDGLADTIVVCDLHRTCTRCLAEAQEAKA